LMSSASPICLNCRHFDAGTYCSACGGKLLVPPSRLNSVVAARLLEEDAFPAAYPDRAGAPPATWSIISEISALLPHSVLLIDELDSSITIVSTAFTSYLDERLCAKLDELFEGIIGWRGKIDPIYRVFLRILVVYEQGCPKEEVACLKRRKR